MDNYFSFPFLKKKQLLLLVACLTVNLYSQDRNYSTIGSLTAYPDNLVSIPVNVTNCPEHPVFASDLEHHKDSLCYTPGLMKQIQCTAHGIFSLEVWQLCR